MCSHVKAVSTNTKIQIWKQITTSRNVSVPASTLYQPIQKYKFESKSQLIMGISNVTGSCINQYKNTNLKANHNRLVLRAFQDAAVSTNTKIQIWKQITTQTSDYAFILLLYQPIQKYKFESKSQPEVVAFEADPGCINQYKNTNLKANHNTRGDPSEFIPAVSTNTKIQIWKQITTYVPPRLDEGTLYQPIQKYKFESKSQHALSVRNTTRSCINQYKNTNLKANHNCHLLAKHVLSAVSTNTKIQIWKQITTVGLWVYYCKKLYQPIQKYKFESKSQPRPWKPRYSPSCINQYKNTNLKANHNCRMNLYSLLLAVSTNTKIQIWKQITTQA